MVEENVKAQISKDIICKVSLSRVLLIVQMPCPLAAHLL